MIFRMKWDITVAQGSADLIFKIYSDIADLIVTWTQFCVGNSYFTTWQKVSWHEYRLFGSFSLADNNEMTGLCFKYIQYYDLMWCGLT